MLTHDGCCVCCVLEHGHKTHTKTHIKHLLIDHPPLQIDAGQPLLLSYGALSNDFLLMDYGFIVHDNPYDTVAMRFDTDLFDVSVLSQAVCVS